MISSSAWLAISNAANQLVSFVVFVVIARLVTPSEFGLVALAAILVELMQVVATSGISDAVIQRTTLEESAADTAFWLNLAGGVGAAALAFAVSGPLETVFATHGLARVIRILALTFVISPIGAIHAARLSREFGFRALALRNIVGNLVSGVVGVWVALDGGGADALLAQRVVAATTIALVGFLSYRWLPRLRFNFRDCRQLGGFALKVVGSTLLIMTNARSIELIAGFVLGPVAVATVRVANRCIDMLMQLTIMPFQQIALPTLSRAQHDPAALRRAYISLSRFSALVIYPAFAGAFALAPVLVPTVFGPQWKDAGATMQIVCLTAITLHFNVLLPATLSAAGHPGRVLGWSAAQLALGVTAAAIGAHFGVLGLVTGNLLRGWLLLPLGMRIMQRRTGVGADAVLNSIARPLGASIVMAAIVSAVESTLTPLLPVWSVLASGAVVGALAYTCLIVILMRNELQDGMDVLPAKMKRPLMALLNRLPRRLIGARLT